MERRSMYLLAGLLIGLMEGCQNSSQAVEGSGRMQRLQVIVGQGLVSWRHGSMVRWIERFMLEQVLARHTTSNKLYTYAKRSHGANGCV